MNGTVYLYVFDTMTDFEIGYLTVELNSGRFFKKGLSPSKVVTLGVEKTPVTTMGGLKIIPDITVADCSLQEKDVLILTGGDTWMDKIHEPIVKLVEQCIKKNIIVAAICGATIRLAQNGLLDFRLHTSNDLNYLKMSCPNYKGEENYINELVVMDGKLITASGVASLQFAKYVLQAMDVFSPETLDAWFNLYETHESDYFYPLMASMQ